MPMDSALGSPAMLPRWMLAPAKTMGGYPPLDAARGSLGLLLASLALLRGHAMVPVSQSVVVQSLDVRQLCAYWMLPGGADVAISRPCRMPQQVSLSMGM